MIALTKCAYCRRGGSAESVTVYPSQIGLQAMADEEANGPRLEGMKPVSVADGGSSDEGEDGEEETPGEFDPDVFRKYELGKLKWFFAIAVFDSVSTAEAVYKGCDGLEYEASGATLDLRYTPDHVQFSQQPREIATDVPLDYRPPTFANKAKSSSKVELSWDQDGAQAILSPRHATTESPRALPQNMESPVSLTCVVWGCVVTLPRRPCTLRAE